MKHSIVTRPAAHADILEHYAFISRDSRAAAERFLVAVETSFELLSQMPHLGPCWTTEDSRLRGIRYHPVKGFPNHLIFYRVQVNVVEVLHVWHGARDVETRLDLEDESDWC